MMRVYLGLGTNLGDKQQNLHTAVEELNKRIGKIISLSAFYETEPWGFASENTFLNAAVCVETALSPQEVLAITQEIERELGRKKKSAGGVYSDRLIDIDLLLFGNLVIKEDNLTIPHPLMTERDFVMKPLAEIAPDLVHPLLHKSMKELISQI